MKPLSVTATEESPSTNHYCHVGMSQVVIGIG